MKKNKKNKDLQDSKEYTPREVAVKILARAHEILKKSDLFKANTAHEIEAGSEPYTPDAEAPEYLANANFGTGEEDSEKKKKGSKHPDEPDHEMDMGEEEEMMHDAQENEDDEMDSDMVEADEEADAGVPENTDEFSDEDQESFDEESVDKDADKDADIDDKDADIEENLEDIDDDADEDLDESADENKEKKNKFKEYAKSEKGIHKLKRFVELKKANRVEPQIVDLKKKKKTKKVESMLGIKPQQSKQPKQPKQPKQQPLEPEEQKETGMKGY